MEEEYDLVIDFEGTKRYEKILSALGYSDKAIRYYIDKPFMGRLPDPDLTYEYSGNCGDHLILDLKNQQTLVLLLFGEQQWCIVFDNVKCTLGLLRNVVMPKVIRTFNEMK